MEEADAAIIRGYKEEIRSLKSILNVYMETNETLLNELEKLRYVNDSVKILEDIREKCRDYRKNFEFELGYSIVEKCSPFVIIPYGRERIRITDELAIKYHTEGDIIICKLISYLHRNQHLSYYHNIIFKDNEIWTHNGKQWIKQDEEYISEIIMRYRCLLEAKKLPKALMCLNNKISLVEFDIKKEVKKVLFIR